MSNYSAIKNTINSKIKQNGTGAITGNILNGVLRGIVDTLGDGYRFKGVVTPSSAAITTDNNVYVIATEQGTYTNFGGLTLASGEVAVLYYDSSWHKATIDLSKLTVGDLFADGITVDGDATINGDFTVSGDGNIDNDLYVSGRIVSPEFAKKANIDGYYSQMGVGVADNLAGRGTAVGAEFTRRTTGGSQSVGDGSARFKDIKGKTIVWNQKFTISAQTKNGLTVTTNADGTFNISGTATALTYFPFAVYRDYSTKKVLITCNKPLSDDGIYFYNTSLGNKKYDNYIFTFPTTTSTSNISLGVNTGTTLNLTNVCVCLFDLTQMGLADTISTVADFKALFPLDYYAYNAGQLLSLNASGIVTDGFNQYNGQYARVFGSKEYYINGAYTAVKFAKTVDGAQTDVTVADRLFTPSEDGYVFVTGADATTCINISWSGRRNGDYEAYWQSTRNLNLTTLTGKVNGQGTSEVIFPDGMMSAGTAHDELIAEGGQLVKAVKWMKIVDMGSLGWAKSGSVFYATLNDAKAPISNSSLAHIICALYPTRTRYSQQTDNVKDVIAMTNGKIVFATPSVTYADAAAFKAAMSGVMLIYELATPVEYVLDEPINANYRISDWGTETITPEGVDTDGVPKTAPMVADIVYGVNAPDILANLPKDYISKASFDDFTAKLATALGLTISSVWDASSNKYVFTITSNE